MAKSFAHESIAVYTTAAVGFTSTTLDKAIELYGRDVDSALVTVESNIIRFTTDGTTPTTAVGHVLASGDIFTCDGEDVRNFQTIAVTATAAIKCTYKIPGKSET